jgi:uncharacterized protein (DUF302 family)
MVGHTIVGPIAGWKNASSQMMLKFARFTIVHVCEPSIHSTKMMAKWFTRYTLVLCM